MKKLFLLLALLGMVAVGCSKDDTDKGNDNKTEQPNENEGGNEEIPVFEIDPEGNYVVESEGGEVLLEVTTNLEYSVYIPKDARSWLFYEETRAVRNETVVLSVEPNSDTELRTATVELRDAEGETLEHFTIVQKPYSIIEDDEPEEDPIFESDNEGSYSITAGGGEIVVTVATNIEYSVDIPKEAQSWISLADTRAVHLEKIVFSVAANDTMTERSAVIKLLGADNEVLQDFTITQGAERNITCNNNEIIYTTKYGYAIDLAITNGFGGNYVSHTFEGGYGKIIFDNDVVTIPLNAFRDCNSITNIYLPSCVQEIGKGAFYGCESLASITLPDSLTKIGEWAFAGCALEYVAIDTLSHWCNITFADDQANPLLYSNDLLVGGEIITTLTIPDDITTINPYAFRGWKNLTNITIHDSVTTIGKYAFSVCENLSEIIIGSGVTTIGDRVFYGCGGVLNINCNIPSVSNYESAPFYNAKLTTVNLGDSVEVVGDYAFRGCDALTEVNLGNGVQSIGKNAFAYCTGLTSVVIPESVAQIGGYIFYECSNLSEVVIGSAVTTIGESAFYNCSSLTSVTIPDSVTTIGNSAFSGCSSLTSVTIPDSLTMIGDAAFSGCSSLQEFKGKFASEDGRCLIIDGVLNSFAPAGLTEYTIPDSVTTIGISAFNGCDSLTSVTIPDSITMIGDEAFYGCTGELIIYSKIIERDYTNNYPSYYGWLSGAKFTKLTIGDGIEKIGEGAFHGCSSLTSLTIGNSVTTIGEYAFSGCNSLTSVTIPNSIIMIGDEAFYGCTGELIIYSKIIETDYTNNRPSYYGWLSGAKFTKLTIGDSVTTIGNCAFMDCSSLTSVTIPDSVTMIGEGAFRYCSSLTSVTIPDSVTTIGNETFQYCYDLTSVTIPDSVTSIGNYAFCDCSSLTSVTIPDSVTSIGSSAFSGCTSELIINSKIIENNYASKPGWLSGAKFTKLTIGDSVTTIGNYAFSGCSSLTSVTIPDSVTTIGSNAFNGCTGELIVNCNIPSASSSSYGAFYGSKFTSVTIGDSVTTIGGYAFNSCNSLTSVTIPDSVTTIGSSAFRDCSSLASITIPDSVTTIGDWAFAGCSSLTSVTIPDSVTMIGDYAFSWCESLTNVYCKATTPPAGGSSMFYKNASGRKIYVPMESEEAYKSASGWGSYSDYIEGFNF